MRVERVDVDLAALSLRINGRTVKESRHVRLGSYHTLDVEPDRWLKLTKAAPWDSLSVEVLAQAVASVGRTEIGAIVGDDSLGLAHVCSVTPQGTRVLQRIEVAMPKRKFGPTSASEKAMERFIGQGVAAMLVHVRFDVLKAIIIAGPAAWRDEVYKRLLETGKAEITGNKSKFMRVNATGGQPAALAGLLGEPRIAAILADTKAAKEAKLLNEYHKMHGVEASRTTFGPKQVQAAAEQGAVRSLLLSDRLFRSTDVQQRKFFGALIEMVRENGGDVMIFSTDSAPEQDLEKLTGVAAILNFPLSDQD